MERTGIGGVRDTGARPTVTTWQLFLSNTAMYVALSMYSETSTPYTLSASERQPVARHTTDNRETVVSQAACQALIRLYPEFKSQTLAKAFSISVHNIQQFTESVCTSSHPIVSVVLILFFPPAL